MWNSDGSGHPRILIGHKKTVEFAVWSPDSARIITASEDNTVRVWKPDTSTNPLNFMPHMISSVAWNRDNKRIVTTVSRGNTAWVWNADDKRSQPIKHKEKVNFAAWSPDGNRLITTSDDKTARIWRADRLTEQARLKGHAGPVLICHLQRTGASMKPPRWSA